MHLYQRLKSKVQNLNFLSQKTLVFLFCFQLIIAGFLLFKALYSPSGHYLEIPFFEPKLSLEKSCYLGMDSILRKKASSHIFDDSLVSQMKEGNYKFFDFAGKERIFDIVSFKEKDHCTVILKDHIGERFFNFKFKDSKEYGHVYGRLIVKIEEINSSNLTEDL